MNQVPHPAHCSHTNALAVLPPPTHQIPELNSTPYPQTPLKMSEFEGWSHPLIT